MFEKFTKRARRVIILAREETGRLGHRQLDTEHFLLGLIREEGCVAATILERMGVELEDIKIEIENRIQSSFRGFAGEEVPFSRSAKKVIEYSIEEARLLGHNYIGTEHLLLGLLREGKGLAAEVLSDLRVDIIETRKEILQFLGSNFTGEDVEIKTPTLDEFSVDLTVEAANDSLDPVIGRKSEISRLIQILSRRTKNNPILIGEPGVGKTAIVEGLAQKIVNNEVPELLSQKRLVSLDIGSIVAGTKYRGQFEERVKTIIKEIKAAKNIIIFIDEVHTLVGAGAAEGSIDASSMLKPELSRGEIQCIGATTLDEYRKHIEKHRALERRFQAVMVEPPTVSETKKILFGLGEKYEKYHKVRISDDAIDTAVVLSDRYITARCLPDKAIDVIDEAAAKVRLKNAVFPPNLREINTKLGSVIGEKKMAIQSQDFELAAKLRDREKKLKKKMEAINRNWREFQQEVEAIVTADDVTAVVSQWTGIPLCKLEEVESEKLKHMEEKLHQRVIAQDEAIKAVAKAIRRSRMGLKHKGRPVGSFIFLGPTGVGKTLLAKTLAEFLFDDETAVIRIDMSEYMEKFSVSRLVGAPPGYVGYDEGGQLTEKVKRRPYSVVLLDEIEKAHPDVFNILLQVLEDGQLTDSLGRTIDFRNTVLIMTSNIGARFIEKRTVMGFQSDSEEVTYENMKKMVMEELRKTFNPEFLNRIDETIVFHSLTKEHIAEIVELFISELNMRLKGKNLQLSLAPDAKKLLVKKSYHPSYGARPLRRVIQKELEDILADRILHGEFKNKKLITVNTENEKLVFSGS